MARTLRDHEDVCSIRYENIERRLTSIEQNIDDIIIPKPDIIKIDLMPNINLLELQNLFAQFKNNKILHFVGYI